MGKQSGDGENIGRLFCLLGREGEIMGEKRVFDCRCWGGILKLGNYKRD